MKIVTVSDTHANLAAFEGLLERAIDQLRCTTVARFHQEVILAVRGTLLLESTATMTVRADFCRFQVLSSFQSLRLRLQF